MTVARWKNPGEAPSSWSTCAPAGASILSLFPPRTFRGFLLFSSYITFDNHQTENSALITHCYKASLPGYSGLCWPVAALSIAAEFCLVCSLWYLLLIVGAIFTCLWTLPYACRCWSVAVAVLLLMQLTSPYVYFVLSEERSTECAPLRAKQWGDRQKSGLEILRHLHF